MCQFGKLFAVIAEEHRAQKQFALVRFQLQQRLLERGVFAQINRDGRDVCILRRNGLQLRFLFTQFPAAAVQKDGKYPRAERLRLFQIADLLKREQHRFADRVFGAGGRSGLKYCKPVQIGGDGGIQRAERGCVAILGFFDQIFDHIRAHMYHIRSLY